MTIGIYSIMHRESGKRYVGKSVNVESRLYGHKYVLTQPVFDKKKCNRHLWNAVQKHGWEAFDTEILEEFDWVDEEWIAGRELHWMDVFRTCERAHGYNLRRDSSTKMIVHEETRALQAIVMRGEGNPNFGNHWSDAMKESMSEVQKRRHAEGFYGDEWRQKQRVSSVKTMSDPDMRVRMSKSVSAAKQQKNDFLQFDRDGNFIRRWYSIEDIVANNPGYKWQNIYSVCNGYKPTYMGFIWRKISCDDERDLLLYIAMAA